MEDFIKICVILDEEEPDEAGILGCLIMNRNTEFNLKLFQKRLNDIKYSDRASYDSYSAEEAIHEVLNKYSEDYKGVFFINNSINIAYF